MAIQVEVRKNNIERSLRIFRQKVKDSELFIELKKREYYKKPSDIKRQKKSASKIRNYFENLKINSEYAGDPPFRKKN